MRRHVRPTLEVVRGRPQNIAARVGAVASPGDELLRVLDPNTDLKRLGLHRHAGLREPVPRVPGAVPDAEHQGVQLDGARGREERAHRPAICPVDRRHSGGPNPVAEANAEFLEPATEPGQHPVEHVRADVRACIEGDVRRSARPDKLVDHRRLQGVRHPRVELPVGVRPGAAVAEQQVVVRVGVRAAVEGHHLAAASLDGLAALDEGHVRT